MFSAILSLKKTLQKIYTKIFGFISNQASEKDIIEDIKEEAINNEENLKKYKKFLLQKIQPKKKIKKKIIFLTILMIKIA